MNYFHVTILYYYVFHLASSGLDATIVNFEMEHIQSPSKLYGCGILTYFPKSDGREDPNHYVYLETLPEEVKQIHKGMRFMNNWLKHNTLGLLRDLMSDITPSESTSSAENMYKIMQSDIEHYIYDDDDDDVFIVYKKKWFTLKFTEAYEAEKFINTLPSSITKLTDQASYDSLMSLTGKFSNLSTS